MVIYIYNVINWLDCQAAVREFEGDTHDKQSEVKDYLRTCHVLRLHAVRHRLLNL
jgi:hypothetical protein